MLSLRYSVYGKKVKTVTPSWKSQVKGEIACMTAVSLRLSCKTSLVMRSEKRRLLLTRAKDINIMRKIYQSPLFNNENACRKSVCIQSTPDNSNLQGKSKTVRVIGSSKKIAGSKEMNSFYCTCSEHFNHI